MLTKLRQIRRKLKHKMNDYPIYKVVEWLAKKNYIQKKRFLEAFANTGEHQAPAYYKYASYFEAWEIDGLLKETLQKNLPKAVIKITDSIKEMQNTQSKFDVIVLDAHMGLFGNGYCEHFDIIPHVFRVVENEFVLILNVMPNAEEKWRKRYAGLFGEEHLARRKDFYGDALDVNSCSYEDFIAFYKSYFLRNGFTITDYFFHQRHLLHYLAIKAVRNHS